MSVEEKQQGLMQASPTSHTLHMSRQNRNIGKYPFKKSKIPRKRFKQDVVNHMLRTESTFLVSNLRIKPVRYYICFKFFELHSGFFFFFFFSSVVQGMVYFDKCSSVPLKKIRFLLFLGRVVYICQLNPIS